ncbi:MAG: extracellular solute-binding protein, partial [Candidatus Colwellbacteria bacterium]|nr:extracellular solute-binding protein [Candidatus Colwellbacteria bacterium]
TWLSKHINKLAPAPSSLVSAENAAALFPKIVSEDFVRGGKVYALPLSIDTLALYYNREIFDKRGVALFPKTWDEVRDLALAKKVPTALGGDEQTVAKAGDVISLLMLQYGAEMGSADGTRATFGSSSRARNALEFYLGFTPPGVDSLRGFANGKVGMMIDYASARSVIKAANPLLNFSILPVPQWNAESPAAAAEYSGFAVSRRSRNPDLAWELVRFIATDGEAAEAYLRASGRPPALRALIERYARSPELGLFAAQSLAAESWPKGDTRAMRDAFSEMVQSVRDGSVNIWEALAEAEGKINRTLKTY